MDGEEEMNHGKYGFGKVRSLREYEKYSGLLFSKVVVQQYTVDKGYPPNPYNFESEEEWLKSFTSLFKHCIDIGFHQVPEKITIFGWWHFMMKKMKLFSDKMVDRNEIQRMMNDPDGYCKVWRQFQY